ncbi:hypothetical protein PMAYCL1PPCAC_08015, partial [Pristionchus mayeri]
LQDEQVHTGALCTRKREGKSYVYRMSQNPYQDGVRDRSDADVLAVVGQKIFYRSQRLKYWISKPAPCEFHVEFDGALKGQTLVYAPNDESPNVYVASGSKMAAVRNGSVVPLEAFPFNGIPQILSIVGVHDGVMTVMANDNTLWQAPIRDVRLPRSRIEKLLEELLRETINLRESISNTQPRTSSSPSREVLTHHVGQMNSTLAKVSIKPRAQSELPFREAGNSKAPTPDQSFSAKATPESEKPPECPMCTICQIKCPNMIFYDCKHVAVCEECYSKATAASIRMTSCPICRKPIRKAEKIFFG